MELKRDAYLNICHENSDRVVMNVRLTLGTANKNYSANPEYAIFYVARNFEELEPISSFSCQIRKD